MNYLFPEPGRLVGHVFLDSVTVHDPDAELEQNQDSVNLTMRALGEIDEAYSIVDLSNGERVVDLSNRVGGAMITIHHLVEQLEKQGLDRSAIVSEAREYLDCADIE